MKIITLLLSISILFMNCGKEDTPFIPIEEDDNMEEEIDSNMVVEEVDSSMIIVEADYKVLNGTIGSWNESTILSADGNVITVGRTRDLDKKRMIIIKTNTIGEEIYTTVFNDENSQAQGVYEDSQMNLYVVGIAEQENPNHDVALTVAKLDSEGSMLWKNKYQTQEDIKGFHISGINDNEIIASGSMDSELVLLKIDSLGQEQLFSKKEALESRTIGGMLILQNENILITGSSWESEIHLRCYDRNFNLLWEKRHGEYSMYARSTIQLDNGDLVTVGHSAHLIGNTNTIDFEKVFILKTDAEGELIWIKEAGDISFKSDGQSIVENEDGSFVITGYATSGPFLQIDHFLIHVDSEGNEINSTYYIDDKTTRGSNIIKVDNGRNVITGRHQEGIFFLNVDNDGL